MSPAMKVTRDRQVGTGLFLFLLLLGQALHGHLPGWGVVLTVALVGLAVLVPYRVRYGWRR